MSQEAALVMCLKNAMDNNVFVRRSGAQCFVAFYASAEGKTRSRSQDLKTNIGMAELEFVESVKPCNFNWLSQLLTGLNARSIW